jgi:hypothetical protein
VPEGKVVLLSLKHRHTGVRGDACVCVCFSGVREFLLLSDNIGIYPLVRD